jgi:hypothetical protein
MVGRNFLPRKIGRKNKNVSQRPSLLQTPDWPYILEFELKAENVRISRRVTQLDGS